MEIRGAESQERWAELVAGAYLRRRNQYKGRDAAASAGVEGALIECRLCQDMPWYPGCPVTMCTRSYSEGGE